jgi:hypothetical protein
MKRIILIVATLVFLNSCGWMNAITEKFYGQTYAPNAVYQKQYADNYWMLDVPAAERPRKGEPSNLDYAVARLVYFQTRASQCVRVPSGGLSASAAAPAAAPVEASGPSEYMPSNGTDAACNDFIRGFFEAGVNLTNMVCEQYFTRAEVSQDLRQMALKDANTGKTLVTALQGIFNLSGTAIATTAVSLDFLTSLNDNYDNTVLVSPDIGLFSETVKTYMGKSYQTLVSQTFSVAPGQTGFSYFLAERALLQYASYCTPLGLKNILNDSLSSAKGASADSGASAAQTAPASPASSAAAQAPLLAGLPVASNPNSASGANAASAAIGASAATGASAANAANAASSPAGSKKQ